MTYCNGTRLAESNTGYDTNITGSVGQPEKGILAHTSMEVVEAAFFSLP